MRRPQFTLRAFLMAMLVVGAFFGGIRFERERRRRADETAASEAFEAQRNKMVAELNDLQFRSSQSNARLAKAMTG
ncbi:MAG TPA: hypothetical protein VFI31_28480 [Pirellulales bacterium]|nr:hypothetical protein [Pirellulales bacterium]